MDSSPDLSLKLRRGSSDSRDNFYMDFAQGIDSDIEEVDNTALVAAAAALAGSPPPPLPGEAVPVTAAEILAMVGPPPPPLMSQPLPTLSETDDLPPTPPPHSTDTGAALGSTGGSLDEPNSPPVSPTQSVLEMIPPPPRFSPPLTAGQQQAAGAPIRAALPPSPPADTEDEGDDADVEEPDDTGDDNDDEDEDGPPPPLPPLPSNLSYLQGGSAGGRTHSEEGVVVTPPMTKSPSTSPSPPVTPPPCPQLTSIGKITSPPAVHVSQIPPLTPPSESDQSQPNSPPPLPQHGSSAAAAGSGTAPSSGHSGRKLISPPPPPQQDDDDDEEDDEMGATASPPPEFEGMSDPHDMVAAVLAAAAAETMDYAGQAMLPSGALLAGLADENRSLNEDESTTITTPPSNGYSTSSIIMPPAEQLGELEDDARIDLASIPPPVGMDVDGGGDGDGEEVDDGDDEDDEMSEEDEEEGEEEDEVESQSYSISQRTPASGLPQPDEVTATDDQNTDDVPNEEAPVVVPMDEEQEQVIEMRGTPTQAVIGSPPKRHSASIASGGGGSGGGSGGGGAGGSRAPSRSVSRSGSRKSTRSGSMRGSLAGSRQGSIAAASVASAAASIASGAVAAAAGGGGSPPIGAAAKGLMSPQASIKSLRSQASISSTHSRRSLLKSPPPASTPISAAAAARMTTSPPEADSPPLMPSPPKIRSPPAALVKSPPPLMHSPPRITTPPRVYSPPLISSPPMRKLTDETPLDGGADGVRKSPPASQSPPEQKSTIVSDAQPPPPSTTLTTTAASDVPTTAAAAAAAAATTTTLSYQNEQPPQVGRPHVSSHHHYHLPHQFQHPHHQNHHTHSVPVATPTVPLTYSGTPLTEATRHKRMVSGGGGGGPPSDHDPPTTSAASRRSPPSSGTAAHTATFVAAPISSSLLLSASSAAASSSVAGEAARLSAISPARSTHRVVTIDESNLPISSSLTHQLRAAGGGDGGGDEDGGICGGGGGGSGPPSPGAGSSTQLATLGGLGDDRQTGHLALMYHSHQLTNYPVLPAIRRTTTHRPSFVYPAMPRVKSGDALAVLFSALYGKLLVVMGIAFPMAEVISTYIPPSFYEVYYLYLYIGSMIFLLFMYATLLWGRPKMPLPNITSPSKSTIKTRSTSGSDSMEESDTSESNSSSGKHLPTVMPSARRPSLLNPMGRQHHYGSFYLRMGAVAFGIGSMIYSGLEFGQYFELNPDTKCHNVLLALTPATRMAFIFIQMYFIFLNNEQIKVHRYKIIARFGLMHMIATNLAVWLNVLIQETKHEILTFYNPENRTLRISHRIPMHSRGHASTAVSIDPTSHLRVPRGLKGPYQIFECRRTNILGTLVQDASPFLFPCTIEYSLICAAILYVMWRSISRPQTPPPQRPDTISSPMKRSPHHYSVDCARAHKGLFVGILILVLTIISLILFFVLISRPDFVSLAVTEVTICELLIYVSATIATLVGMIQMRHLQYDAFRSFSLDDILLVGAQTGTFLYNIFTVIAGHFTLRSDDMLVPINALTSIVQTACQTMFILDASRRQAVKPEHIRKKPGREIVTFMLVVNLAMWAISTLEKSRAESHPIQLNFYGLWAWTIITHVSMPLAIFYRFHSTVCLCEIWKRAYKLKPTYM